MNSMVRERDTHVSRLFIEVTPGIRRALELLAEASITLLDEIDAPVDGLEADEDFEITHEDDEDGDDAEMEHAEPNDDGDEDFVAPDTTGGFFRNGDLSLEQRAVQRALFDPRIALRGSRGRFVIPAFPHESADRPRLYIDEEIRRLNAVLWGKRKRKGRRQTV